ncbi:MAG: nucleotide-binding protein [Cenarchaeum symbiont of Oopsacas minuta]|nr:nucleotide-binding protein [Cenarchaeum symbiont of Oopsacas minuta]
MADKEKFINAAKSGKILVEKCTKCSHRHLATVYFCQKCGGSDFVDDLLKGSGKVVTYTIITVPPSGFEKYVPYAWVVMKLDDSDLRISGFMTGIKTPSDLPIGTESRVIGFDDHGILIERK